MSEREIFLQVLEIPDRAQRAAFLERACRDQPALRAAVDHLLQAHERAGTLLTQPYVVASAEVTKDFDAHPGQIIAGKYKLLQQIGEGGMGSVWMADQTEPVKRRVAVKFIGREQENSKSILSRFEAERQAIALMDHPHIAKLLDADSTGTEHGGCPFFVMELVKGVPLTEFCDERKLSVPERLNLFVQICSAVQHAHQKGIIHRDLKPTNILVELHDDKPVPKVIDFGLAKALSGQPLSEHTLFTAFNTVAGTLQYMAPEQAKFNAIDIDTRADIYALGVILYELLTGSTPLERAALKQAALDEVLRLVRESEPQTPSRRLSTTQSKPAVAANRDTEPQKLGRFVKGELDWIVMKALAKERDRRYDTANGLARDIERFLNHEPVLAGPPSTSYRLRKFVERNRGQVAAAALVVFALLAGVVGTTFEWVHANRARVRAETAEREAGKRADELQQVADYQSKMLQQIDPAEAGIKLTADLRTRLGAALENGKVSDREKADRLAAFDRELHAVNATDAAVTMLDGAVLAPSVRAIDSQFAGQPKIDASLRMTLGAVYEKLGRAQESLALFRRAYALRVDSQGQEQRDTLHSLAAVGGALSTLQMNEAESTLRRALESCRRALGPDDPETLAVQNLQALLLFRQGKLEECEACSRDVLQRRIRVLGPEHTDTLSTLNDLGMFLTARDKRDEAVATLRTAVDGMRRQPNTDPNTLLSAIDNLGQALQEQGKLAEAEPCFRECLEKRRRNSGEDHPLTLLALNNLAALLQDMNRLDEAEPLAREAVEKSRRIRGDEHRETLVATNVLALTYQRQGKPEKAELLYRQTLATGRRVMGEDHPDTIIWASNLATLLADQGKYAEAEPLSREVVTKMRRVFGNDHMNSIATLANLGALLGESGKLEEAESTLREALAKVRRAAGDGNPLTFPDTIRLGQLLATRGKAAEAVNLLAPIELKVREAYPGAQAHRVARLLLGLGKARISLAKMPQDFAAATANLSEAREIYVKTRGPDHRDTRASTQALADAYAAWSRSEPGKGHDAKAAEWKAKLTAP